MSIFAAEPDASGGRDRDGGGRAPEDGDGWLFLFVILLIAPPSAGPHRGGGPADGTGGTDRGPEGDEPPAGAGRSGRAGYVRGAGGDAGLTRPRLSGRRIGLLRLLLFVPVATVPAAVAAAHQHYWLAWAAGLYVAGAALAGGAGNSRRRTAAGQAALKRQRGCLAPLAIITGAALYIAAAVWAGPHGLVGLAHRATPPPFAEFDGQVIRQWVVKGDSDSPDEYHVAVDDGTRETAWDFDVGGERYRRLTAGTFVHVRVRPLIAVLSVHGTVPAGSARLTALPPVVEGRLREVATRMSWPVG
jgi:hypothetical protein